MSFSERFCKLLVGLLRREVVGTLPVTAVWMVVLSIRYLG